MIFTCKNCGKLFELPASVTRFVCACSSVVELPIQPIETCLACKYLIDRKCKFYIRPCSTLKLWRGELPPPEQCPNKEQFENP